MKLLLFAALTLALGGCATVPTSPATVGGSCAVFSDPGFAVRGKTLKDNQWIGRTQETGIQVCGWKRPVK